MAHEQHSGGKPPEQSGGHVEHDMMAMFKDNERALKISAALTSGKNIFSAHVQIDEGIDTDAVLLKGNKILTGEFGIYFSPLQVEHDCDQLGQATEINSASSTGHGSLHQTEPDR
ncbi:MAG: hypothetical protein COB36_13480 [Alphaproteobacteria bacterium]|nr:MAG: hypothetical protein COB36_13480 [Alphaproteobacteria bacterium]